MIAWWWASRPGRTLALYLDSRGPLLARGMSFSAVFSVFAAVYVFFAIFGILFESNTGLRDAVVAGLASTIPGLIDTGGGGAIDVDALFDVQLLGVSGVLVMLALVFTASGWLRSFRAGVRTIFGLPQKYRAFLLMRLIDNICANIVKHGSPSQSVELTASVEEGFLVLRESNAVLRKTVKTAAGDSGYGLVICEDVMSALGGSVSHGTEDGRFCIVLRFPILPGRE